MPLGYKKVKFSPPIKWQRADASASCLEVFKCTLPGQVKVGPSTIQFSSHVLSCEWKKQEKDRALMTTLHE